MIPSSDQDVEDVTLGKMLTEAHRGQADYCGPEGVSDSQSSSSVMFDGSGKPDERNCSNAQIRTLLEEQRQTIIAEYREKVGHHELRAADAEEERRLLQGQLWRQKLEFREAHQQILTEMEELRKFQSSTFDTIARRKLIEDQNTILELSGRVQDLQNEVNCMNDSKDFEDAESVRSGNPTLPVDQCHFHLIRYVEECCDSLSYRRAAKKGRQAFGTHMVYRETFLQIQMRLLQHLVRRNCINGIRQLRSRSIHLRWRKVKGQNKIEIRDASLDRQPKIQSSSMEETLQRFMEQTNNDCRFLITI